MLRTSGVPVLFKHFFFCMYVEQEMTLFPWGEAEELKANLIFAFSLTFPNLVCCISLCSSHCIIWLPSFFHTFRNSRLPQKLFWLKQNQVKKVSMWIWENIFLMTYCMVKEWDFMAWDTLLHVVHVAQKCSCFLYWIIFAMLRTSDKINEFDLNLVRTVWTGKKSYSHMGF